MLVRATPDAPWTVRVPDADLADLRSRLAQTRWPEPATTPGWDQGMPLEHAQELCRYWANGYDWRRTEATLNAWPQDVVTIDGLALHVLHARSPEPDALPLLLTHGWPGSMLEFLKILGPLTDPRRYGGASRDAFHVVVASLPGYGFSERPGEPGWGIERIAAAWSTLMARLGYPRYGAAGSDWGTSVTSVLAGLDAAHVAGIHLIPPLAPPDRDEPFTAWERDAVADLQRAAADGSAYSETHRTRPQTIGYGLVDSPVALLTWIGEKFHAWTDRSAPTALTRDDLLDTVSLYWFTRTGASAARLYRESIGTVSRWITDDPGEPVRVPVGASVFGRETPRISQRWARRRFPDIRLWREHDHGGHFAALEVPDLVVGDLRDFFRSLQVISS